VDLQLLHSLRLRLDKRPTSAYSHRPVKVFTDSLMAGVTIELRALLLCKCFFFSVMCSFYADRVYSTKCKATLWCLFVPLSAHSAFFVSTFEVTNSWHYTNMFIIILYIFKPTSTKPQSGKLG